jgi:hypothetical protein
MGCSSSDIFLIKAETYANSGDFGYPCLDGESPSTFLNKFIAASTNSMCVGNSLAGLFRSIGYNCNSSELRASRPEVNVYGNLVNNEYYYSLTSTQKTTQVYESPSSEYCAEGGIYAGNFKLEIENGIITQNTADCSNQVGTPPGCSSYDPGCIFGNGICPYSPYFLGGRLEEGFGTVNISCTQASQKGNEDCEGAEGKTTSNYNAMLSNLINYDLLFPLAKDAVPKKLEIYENNLPQDSQGNKCQGENYGPNGCYGFPAPNAGFAYDTLHAPTGLQDNSPSYSVITQKWRVRLGDTENFVKNNLSEKYTLYVYYYTGENPDTSITPCCNSCNCFDGIILKQKDITLTYNNNKKGDYILSQDYLEFDNFDYSGPSKNLYYCSK